MQPRRGRWPLPPTGSNLCRHFRHGLRRIGVQPVLRLNIKIISCCPQLVCILNLNPSPAMSHCTHASAVKHCSKKAGNHASVLSVLEVADDLHYTGVISGCHSPGDHDGMTQRKGARNKRRTSAHVRMLKARQGRNLADNAIECGWGCGVQRYLLHSVLTAVEPVDCGDNNTKASTPKHSQLLRRHS